MAYESNVVSLVGNLTADPEVRHTGGGKTVVNFTVAHNHSKDNASFFHVVAWEELGEMVADTFGKGDRVAVLGVLRQDTWEAKDGGKRSRVEIVADEVNPSKRFAGRNGGAAQKVQDQLGGEPVDNPPEVPF